MGTVKMLGSNGLWAWSWQHSMDLTLRLPHRLGWDLTRTEPWNLLEVQGCAAVACGWCLETKWGHCQLSRCTVVGEGAGTEVGVWETGTCKKP